MERDQMPRPVCLDHALSPTSALTGPHERRWGPRCRMPACSTGRGRVGASTFFLLAGAYVALAVTTPAFGAGPQGVWLTEDRDAALTITDCGPYLCGRIIWLENARDRTGSLRVDGNNPNPARQMERICGMVVINSLEPSGPDTWEGRVYNPQDGNTYNGSITVLSDTTLRLRAYIGLPIFGKSQTWSRVDGPAADGLEYSCRGEE